MDLENQSEPACYEWGENWSSITTLMYESWRTLIGEFERNDVYPAITGEMKKVSDSNQKWHLKERSARVLSANWDKTLFCTHSYDKAKDLIRTWDCCLDMQSNPLRSGNPYQTTERSPEQFFLQKSHNTKLEWVRVCCTVLALIGVCMWVTVQEADSSWTKTKRKTKTKKAKFSFSSSS